MVPRTRRLVVSTAALVAVAVAIVLAGCAVDRVGPPAGTSGTQATTPVAATAPAVGDERSLVDTLQRERADVAAAPRYAIVIVDERGDPVPGAHVAWLPSWDTFNRPFTTEAWQHREQQVRSAGRQAFANDRGQVDLGLPVPALVVARAGERYGQDYVAHHGTLPRVVIAPEVSLRAQVVDEAGRGRSNVPVSIAWHHDDVSRHLPWAQAAKRFVALSDESGHVVVPCVGALPHWQRDELRVALWASVLGSHNEPVEVRLDAPPPLVRVVVPPHGFADLRFVGTDGLPMRAAEQTVRLAGTHSWPPFSWHEGLDPHFVRWSSPASARIGPLQLRDTWALEGRLHAEFAGPRTDEEVVSVAVTRAMLDTREITVRLHGPDGSVLTDTEVSFGVDRPPARTDHDGWLWTMSYDVVSCAQVAAWAPLVGAKDGDHVHLRPAITTHIAPIDAADGAAMHAWVRVHAIGTEPARVFEGKRLLDGRVLFLSSGPGTLEVQCSADDYEARTVQLAAGAERAEISLSKSASWRLSAIVLVDPSVPASALDVQLHDAKGATSRLDFETAPGRQQVTWHRLDDGPHRLEVRLATGLAPIRSVDDLRPAVAGEPVVVDLRAMQLGVATFSPASGVVQVTDGSRWTEVPGSVLLMPRDAEWQGFVEDGDGLPTLFPVRPGTPITPIERPRPVLCVTVPGAGVAFDPRDVSVHVYLLRVDEPLLAAVEAQDRSPDADPDSPPEIATLTPEQLASLEPLFAMLEITGPELRVGCPRRGVYVAVPFLGETPLIDQALEIRVDGAKAEVDAALTIDPQRLADARRAAAEAKGEGTGR